MRLLIAHHLNAVLDFAQKPVGIRQAVAGLGVDPLRLGQCRKRCLCRTNPKRSHAPARNQLLRLREELNLANAAATKLDIVPLHRNCAMALMGVDLPLDRVDIGNRRIVQIFAKHEGRQLPQEVHTRLDVASHRPRLDIGCPLPVLALPS